MTKKEVQEHLWKDGKPLPLRSFHWNAETRTLRMYTAGVEVKGLCGVAFKRCLKAKFFNCEDSMFFKCWDSTFSDCLNSTFSKCWDCTYIINEKDIVFEWR